MTNRSISGLTHSNQLSSNYRQPGSKSYYTGNRFQCTVQDQHNTDNRLDRCNRRQVLNNNPVRADKRTCRYNKLNQAQDNLHRDNKR
jgi:hypothetical protein